MRYKVKEKHGRFTKGFKCLLCWPSGGFYAGF
jgi:hypothetical protein